MKPITRKQIGILVLCLFAFSFILSLNDVRSFQTENDNEITLHCHLDSDNTEINSNDYLESPKSYTFFEQPELDVSESVHDLTSIDVKNVHSSITNTTKANSGDNLIASNSQENFTTDYLYEYENDAPLHTEINISVETQQYNTIGNLTDTITIGDCEDIHNNGSLNYKIDNEGYITEYYINWTATGINYNVSETINHTTALFFNDSKWYVSNSSHIQEFDMSFNPLTLYDISGYGSDTRDFLIKNNIIWVLGTNYNVYEFNSTFDYQSENVDVDHDPVGISFKDPYFYIEPRHDAKKNPMIFSEDWEYIANFDGRNIGTYMYPDDTNQHNTIYKNYLYSWEANDIDIYELINVSYTDIAFKTNTSEITSLENANAGFVKKDNRFYVSLSSNPYIREYDSSFTLLETYNLDLSETIKDIQYFSDNWYVLTDNALVYKYNADLENQIAIYNCSEIGTDAPRTFIMTETHHILFAYDAGDSYIYKYNLSWGFIEKWEVWDYPRDMFYDGSFIWASFDDSTYLYKHDLNFNYLRQKYDLSSQFSSYPYFTFDNDYIYTYKTDKRIYKYEFESVFESYGSQLNNFKYQILGVNYTQNTINLNVSSWSSLNYGYNITTIFSFNSSALDNYQETYDLKILTQQLDLTLNYTNSLIPRFNYSVYIQYNKKEWEVPTEQDLQLNSNDITDQTYNSGYVHLDSFPNNLDFDSDSLTYFTLNSTSYFTFTFDLEIISKTYLKKSFKLLSNHNITIDTIDFDSDLEIKKIYFNNDDLGSSNPATANKNMQQNNIYTLEVILREESYIKLDYIKNNLGSGTASSLIRGLTNKLNFQDVSQYSSISFTLPEGFEAYQSMLTFSDINYKEYYQSNSSEDLHDYGYETSESSGNENVEWSAFEYYEEGKNGTKTSETSVGGYYNVDNETFDSENAEMSHSYTPDSYNSSYAVNSNLTMNNYFPNEQHSESFLNWNLNYDNDYTDSSHSNGDFESTLDSYSDTDEPSQWSDFTFDYGSSGSSGNLTSIDSNYATIDSTYYGYEATYRFEDDSIDNPRDFNNDLDFVDSGTYDEVDNYADVVDMGQYYDNSMRLVDADGTNELEVFNNFGSSQPYGTIEFHFRVETDSDSFWYWNLQNADTLYLGHRGTSNQLAYYAGGSWNEFKSITEDQWYHARLDYETTTGGYLGLGQWRWDLYIDGVQEINSRSFYSLDTPSRFGFQTAGSLSGDTQNYRIDNIGYSFGSDNVDGDYQIGDNEDPVDSYLDVNAELSMDTTNFDNTEDTLETYRVYYSTLTTTSITQYIYAYDYIDSEWDQKNTFTDTSGFESRYIDLTSRYYDGSYNCKIRFYSEDTSSEFDYQIDMLKLYTEWTTTSGNLNADITKDVDFSFLNRYDANADYQDLYNVSIEFEYTFTLNNSDYSSYANYSVNYQNFGLTRDGSPHSFSYNFIFNSSSSNNFTQFFNISNGLLEVSNFEYKFIFECLDTNDLNNISQYFELDPTLSLDYLQKTRGIFYLNFSIDFTQDTLFNYYSFHNGLNYSLFSYNLSINHEDGWNSSYFNTNSSITQNISFNISNFLSNLGKSQFLDYKIEFYLSGNNTHLVVDDIYLYDYDSEFYNVSNVYVSDYLLVYDQNITLSFEAIDRYIAYVEIYQTLTSKNLIYNETLSNNTLQQKVFSNETVGFYELELTFYDELGNYETWIVNYTIITLANSKIGYQNPVLIGDNATFSVQISSKDAIYQIHYDNSTNYRLQYDNTSYPLHNYSFSFTVSYDIETSYNISIRIEGHSSGVFYCNITNLEFVKRSTKVSIHNLKSSYEQGDSFNISIDLRDLYNNPLSGKAINYTLQDPNDTYVLNSSDTTDSDGEIIITQNFSVSWDIGFYHLNISFTEDDNAYLSVWELTSFEILPVSQTFTNCSSINLKVNGNNVSGTTITINNTSSFNFEHLDNSTFDLELQFYLNYSESISYNGYLDYSYTFEATSDITQLTLETVNLTNIPSNFTNFYVNDLRTTNYTLSNDTLQANSLNSDMYNDNSISLKLRYYQDQIKRTQITSNPTTSSNEVVFQETLLANRSFKYWYIENGLDINSLSLEHIRTSTTINSFDTDNSSNRYYFSQDCENQDLFTGTINYDPNWQISTQKITNNYGETRIKVSYKADLEINNVSLVLNLKSSSLFNGKATSNHLLTINNVNFTTSTQVLYVSGNRTQYTSTPVEDLNSVDVNETFYYDSEIISSNIITLNPRYNVSYKVLKNNGTYSKLEITKKSEFPLNNVDLSLDLSAYNLYNENWTLGASQSESTFILYIPDVSFTTQFTSFTIEGYSDVPYANITSYESDNTWHHISVDEEVDMYAYLEYSKFTKVFKLNTSSEWEPYNVYYAADIYAAETIAATQVQVSGNGFDPSVNSSYLHFKTKPFSKATFDFTDDMVTIEITADYTIDNCYFLYQFDPTGVHDLVVWQTGDIEISNVTDSEYNGYLYFETTQIPEGEHTIQIYVDFATPLEMLIQMILPICLSIAIVGVYYYLKNNEEVYEKLKEKLNDTVIDKLQKARGDEGFEAATITVKDDKIFVSPAER